MGASHCCESKRLLASEDGMLRRILRIIALLASLTHSIIGWTATIAGDEHVSSSESVPYLQLRDD